MDARSLARTPAFRASALAYAGVLQERGRREAEHVTVDLGSGVTWRLRRADYERIVRRPSRLASR